MSRKQCVAIYAGLRERYRLQREREMVEEREVRLAKRREYYRRQRVTITTRSYSTAEKSSLQH